jgi:DNA-binding CsgD family transcriptional regulator
VPAAVPQLFLNSHNTSLAGVQMRTKIQQSALAIAERIADETDSDSATSKPSVTTLQIDGASYLVQREVVQSAGAPVVLVAIERCQTTLPSMDDLQRVFALTRAEAFVTALLATRKSNREVAVELKVTEHTARRHTEHVLKKLKIHCRTDVQHVLSCELPGRV